MTTPPLRSEVGGADAGEPALRSAATAGVRWSAVSMVGTQLSRVLFSLLLALLLGPEAMGVVGQATVFVVFSTLLLDQGFGMALVQKATITEDDRATAFTLNLLSAVVLVALTLALAPWYEDFMRTPGLALVLSVLSGTLLLKATFASLRAQLVRRLDFKLISMIEVGAVALSGVAGTAAALLDAGHWALVVQSFVLDGTAAVFAVFVAGLPRLRIRRASLREMWGFSRNVLGAQLLSFVSRNSDNLVVGRVLGAAALGHYGLAYRVLTLPLQLFGQTVTRVTFPVLSRVSADPPAMARAFLLGTRCLVVVIVPCMTALAALVPLLVREVFGPVWAPAVPVMQVFCVTAVLQVSLSLVGPTWMAAGRPQYDFRYGLANSTLSLASFVAGAHLAGVVGVAFGYTAVIVVLLPLTVALLRRVMPLPVGDLLRAVGPALLVGALAAGVTFGLPALHPGPVGEVAGVLLGAAAYVGLLALVARDTLRTTLAVAGEVLPLHRLRRRRA